MRSNAKPIVLLAALFSVATLGGCEIAQVNEPVTMKFGADDPDSQLDFWHELAQQPIASNDEATHAILLFVDGKSGELPYDQRIAAMKSRKLLPKGFSSPANQAVLRGTLAYALVEALKIRGGVTMSIFGNSPRYATRELVDMELFPLSTPGQTFSGAELVGIFGKAEDFQRGGGGEKTPEGLAGNVDQHRPATQPTP